MSLKKKISNFMTGVRSIMDICPSSKNLGIPTTPEEMREKIEKNMAMYGENVGKYMWSAIGKLNNKEY